jgi:hypothetical protein
VWAPSLPCTSSYAPYHPPKNDEVDDADTCSDPDHVHGEGQDVREAHLGGEGDQGVHDTLVGVAWGVDAFWNGGSVGSRLGGWLVVDLASGMDSCHGSSTPVTELKLLMYHLSMSPFIFCVCFIIFYL